MQVLLLGHELGVYQPCHYMCALKEYFSCSLLRVPPQHQLLRPPLEFSYLFIMNGQYIYNPPPPPPSSGGNNRRGGGALRGASRGGGQNRSRPQPYEVPVPRPGAHLQQPKQPRPEPSTPVSAKERSVVVPGTRISLNTQEEIEAWINERKKKWPTTARVEAKEQEKARQAAERKAKYEAEKKAREEQNQELAENGRELGDGKRRQAAVCKFYARNKKCSNGDRCKFLHQPGNSGKPASSVSYKLYEAPTKMPLYKMLVRNDLDQENGPVIDFIRYLFENNKI